MAKVYDALKQVEAERSLQLRRAAERERVSAGAAPEPTLWKRVSGRLAGRSGGADEMPLSAVPERVFAERFADQRVDSILGRVDALEQLAVERLPEIEQRLQQLLDVRLGAAERELAASMATLRHQMRRESAEMRRRYSLLLAGAALLMAVVLLRA